MKIKSLLHRKSFICIYEKGINDFIGFTIAHIHKKVTDINMVNDTQILVLLNMQDTNMEKQNINNKTVISRGNELLKYSLKGTNVSLPFTNISVGYSKLPKPFVMPRSKKKLTITKVSIKKDVSNLAMNFEKNILVLLIGCINNSLYVFFSNSEEKHSITKFNNTNIITSIIKLDDISFKKL